MDIEHEGLCVGGPCDGERRGEWGDTMILVALTPWAVLGEAPNEPDTTEHTYCWRDGSWRYEGAA